jgi:hypothetical protein
MRFKVSAIQGFDLASTRHAMAAGHRYAGLMSGRDRGDAGKMRRVSWM